MSGFSNPLVGGRENLVRTAIQSPNFVHLVSGWRIAKNGIAEFNSVIAVGSFAGTVVFADTIHADFYSSPNNSGTYAAGWSLAPGVNIGDPIDFVLSNTDTIRFRQNVISPYALELINGSYMIPTGPVKSSVPVGSYINKSNAVTATTVAELKDGGCGDYQIQAVAGHCYEAVYDARCRSNSATSVMDLYVRGVNGVGPPTTADTIYGAISQPIAVAAGAGAVNAQIRVPLSCPTDIAAGLWTFAPFYKLTAGAGPVNVDQAGGTNRFFYITDIGTGG